MKDEGRIPHSPIVNYQLSIVHYASSFFFGPGDDDDGASQGDQQQQNAAAEQMSAHSKNVSQYHNAFPFTPNTARAGQYCRAVLAIPFWSESARCNP
jgi:hypothetical protein